MSHLKSKVKRGCSEFYNSFPSYNIIESDKKNYMTYNQDWEKIEENLKIKKNFNTIKLNMDGVFLGELDLKRQDLKKVGRFIGNLSKELKNYSNDSIASRKWPWDIQNLSLNKKYLKYIPDPSNRKIVLFFFQQFEEFVFPQLDKLRTSIIHNDTNEWNILLKKNKELAIIDFGDLAKTPLVNEVAIAMVYASYSNENPLENASIILKSYNKVIKLTNTEISLLYYLMASKL